MRPDGSRSERLTSDQAVYAAPVVSPDGQSIAVASCLGGSWNGIYLLDRFGKGRTKLVSHSTFDGSPAWSPDGTKIAFRSSLPGPYGDYGRIFIVNRDGTGLRQLTPEVAATDYKYDDGPSWSPDGTRLVFSRTGVLFLINADGTGLVSTGVNGEYPAWSPDGTQIAYGSINGGNDGIWAMDMSFSPAGSRHRYRPINGLGGRRTGFNSCFSVWKQRLPPLQNRRGWQWCDEAEQRASERVWAKLEPELLARRESRSRMRHCALTPPRVKLFCTLIVHEHDLCARYN